MEDKKPLAVKDFEENELHAEVYLVDYNAEVMESEVGVGTEFGCWVVFEFPVKVFKAETGVFGEQVAKVLESWVVLVDTLE